MNIGIIPARYASTRFPGKPLALIAGKPMIQHVFERASEAHLDKLIVATDNELIFNTVIQFGGCAVMTSELHQSGTDRCGEVVKSLKINNSDVVVNIQGDEPFIRKDEINLLVGMFKNPEVNIATLAKPITRFEEIENPNKVKVVLTKKNKALYFSRFPIPFLRNNDENVFFKHLGIYAYRADTLLQLINLPQSHLECCEKLEQLRWLENDFSIFVSLSNHESIAIDTPEDLAHLNY